MIRNLEITQNDIDSGERNNMGKSPFLKPFLRIVKKDVDVVIGNERHLAFSNKIGWFDLFLPNELQDFIVKYHLKGENVKPIKFEIDLPDIYLKT